MEEQEQKYGQKISIELTDWQFSDDDADQPSGPVVWEYENTKGHQVGQHWVAVFTEDDKTVIIPSTRINKIVVSKE